MAKKSNKLIVFILVLVSLGYFYFQYEKFSKVKEDFINLKKEEGSLGKYLYLYSLTYNKTPDNITQYKDFIKKQNLNYYDLIKNIDLKFIKDGKLRFDFYLLGFDGKNDSLDLSYNPVGMTFLSSLNKKGDILLDNSYNLPLYKNGVHKIIKDTIVKVHNINILDFYKGNFNCKYIKLKDLNLELKNITIRIKGANINILNSTFSDTSTQLFIDDIKNRKKFKLDDSVYLIKIQDYNIVDYTCDDG